MSQTIFRVQTRGSGLTEMTEDVRHWVSEAGIADGLLTLFVRHTSCSILIQENADPEVQNDLQEWLRRTVPPSSDRSMSYLTHTYEGPDDMPGHIRAAILPVSLSIPVASGAPMLGRWQGIYLWEHRDRPHLREVAANLR